MKRKKNKIREKVVHWMETQGVFNISVVMAGFLTLTSLGVVTLLLFATCRQAPASGGQKDAATEDTLRAGMEDTLHAARYRRPEIPQMMTDPQQRAFYYVKHYWDEYSLADTAFIRSTDTEQLFADFVDALKYVDLQESGTALRNMMNLMETDSTAYAHFCFLSEKYFYDPNSPMRNEEYYIPVLEQMLDSHRLTEYEKLRPADQLEQTLKNRPGDVAADFTYVTPQDMNKAQRMSSVKADYTLLFFYNPDCSNCREYEGILAGIPAFVELQEKGALRVLAVYPDEDRDEWLLKSPHMPKGWIVGWNRQGDIRGKMLYDIRATPTLYLLDKQKKVILKDAPLERVIQYLAAVYPQQAE